MSYFQYIDNGKGPVKLFLGGVHGNEGKTSIRFIKSIKNEDLSDGQFYFYNFDRTDYISTLNPQYYESELGQKILGLINYFEPDFYTELHCYDLKNYEKLTSMERYRKTGVPPLIPAGDHILVSSVSPLIRMTYFSTETVCKTLEFPCIEKLTPEVCNEFNFDKTKSIERYNDLLRLITKSESRPDFEKAILKKYPSQATWPWIMQKKYSARISLHINVYGF